MKEGIVLGHRVFGKGIGVDKAKIKTIEKFPPLTSMKGIISLLGHAGFYRRSIKDFSIISKPLANLLMHAVIFCFDEMYITFTTLNDKLKSTPIFIAQDWELPFELMCDASDYAVGDVLVQ